LSNHTLFGHRLFNAAAVGRVILCLFLAACPASAQQPSPDDPLAFFYKDPRPERMVELFTRAQNDKLRWNAYPPMTGLFAVVFRQNPKQIDRLVPSVKDATAASALVAAARLSGQPAKAEALRTRFAGIGQDERLNAEFAGLPTRIEDLRIATPTHLDLFWGASFAAGDGRYVQPIIDFYAKTADASEPVAIDVAKIVIEMAGGPKGAIAGLKEKYGEAGARQMIFAASALWAIRSNAIQHAYVKQTTTKYIQDHPGTPATKALSAVTGIK
jgi:hypothetical protein